MLELCAKCACWCCFMLPVGEGIERAFSRCHLCDGWLMGSWLLVDVMQNVTLSTMTLLDFLVSLSHGYQIMQIRCVVSGWGGGC